MVNLVALGSKNLEVRFLDAANNQVTPAPTDVIEWSVTGPATLSATFPSSPTTRALNSTGQIGTGEVKAILNPGASQIVATEPYTVVAGPITHGVIVATN
jgi:hypothetical protein